MRARWQPEDVNLERARHHVLTLEGNTASSSRRGAPGAPRRPPLCCGVRGAMTRQVLKQGRSDQRANSCSHVVRLSIHVAHSAVNLLSPKHTSSADVYLVLREAVRSSPPQPHAPGSRPAAACTRLGSQRTHLLQYMRCVRQTKRRGVTPVSQTDGRQERGSPPVRVPQPAGGGMWRGRAAAHQRIPGPDWRAAARLRASDAVIWSGRAQCAHRGRYGKSMEERRRVWQDDAGAAQGDAGRALLGSGARRQAGLGPARRARAEQERARRRRREISGGSHSAWFQG